MFSSLSLSEITQIVSGDFADPHLVLGLHQVKVPASDKKAMAIRAFIPGAKKVWILYGKNMKTELNSVHDDGFFEAILSRKKNWFSYRLEAESESGNRWIFHDPYSFMPQISELDIHLFGEGNHYRIYEKLGAHFACVDGVDGVLFGLWAPNAKRVSVIGNFNNWDGRRHMMRLLANSGVWELFIPGLSYCDQYKFEIKSQFGDIVEKSDPYGNFHQLRPGHSSLIFNLKDYKFSDGEWLEKRRRTNPLDSPVNIYELHLGSWKKSKDENRGPERFMSYLELADEVIPYVAEMGYTHIELLPVSEYPLDMSWGYQVTGYFAPTSRHGNPHEFMAFVDRAHQYGIGVILDWVPAHFPKDRHGLARFDGTALYEHEDPERGEHPDWGTLVFNYGRNEVKNFLIANAIFWIEVFHLDGLRVDAVASMLYLDYGRYRESWLPNKYGGRENLEAVEFLKHLNSVVLGSYPGVMIIAEESTSWPLVTRPPEIGGLGFNLKWNMGWMNDFLSYMSYDPVHRKHHHTKLTFGMMYNHTENFVLVLSHDEVVHLKKSLIGKMPGDIWQKCANLRLAFTFMFGHPGKKLVFMGGEFGQFVEWSEERELDWFLLEYEHHRGVRDFVKDLNHLYKSHPAFWAKDYKQEGFEWIDPDDANRSQLSFIRRAEGETLVFLCNFTPVPLTEHRIGLPVEGRLTELINSDDSRYGGSGIMNHGVLTTEPIECNHRKQSISVKVPPLGAVVLRYIE